MRMEQIYIRNDITVINDAYNASPNKYESSY